MVISGQYKKNRAAFISRKTYASQNLVRIYAKITSQIKLNNCPPQKWLCSSFSCSKCKKNRLLQKNWIQKVKSMKSVLKTGN
jgi:hypothetical protein